MTDKEIFLNLLEKLWSNARVTDLRHISVRERAGLIDLFSDEARAIIDNAETLYDIDRETFEKGLSLALSIYHMAEAYDDLCYEIALGIKAQR